MSTTTKSKEEAVQLRKHSVYAVAMAQSERLLLEWYLNEADHCVADAARMLEIESRALYRRLEILGVELPERSDNRGRPRKSNGVT